jgi:acyl-CoA synthetase (AMP-forming)/AMP-acid ligase II
MFDAQVRFIGSNFGIKPGEIDLPTFPLFALFDPALGMTAIIPDMDPTKPALVDPESIIEPIFDHGVTNMFASPALLNRVGRYCKECGIKFPTLRRVVSAGAPVSAAIIETFSTALNEKTQIYTPYGATEAMPVLTIGSHEILTDTRKFSEKGFGTCIGRPVEGINVKIIKITDEPIEEWSEELEVAEGDIGEITVKGAVASRNYFDRPDADKLAKIVDGDEFWHRMGDLGWMDKKGRIWFCGRKSHRIVTEKGALYTVPCEALFNNHPGVYRSALVGIGDYPKQKPVICIEPEPTVNDKSEDVFIKELLEIAKKNAMTEQIDTILIHDSFPVDIRHNSKIFREQLAEWAQRKLV